MDPTANLEEQVRVAKRIMECQHEAQHQTRCRCVDDAERLAELVRALDAWIVRGGFLPDAWKGAQR